MDDHSLRPLSLSRFDLDTVLMLMESQRLPEDSYLDLETGRALVGSEGARLEFEGVDVDLDDDRFLLIERGG